MTQQSEQLDRRINAVRAELAASELEGRAQASRYAAPRPMRVTAGKAELHRAPDRDAPVDTQLLCGDVVDVYDEAGNWAWVQNQRDRYVGYLPKGCLSENLVAATHRVTALSTFAYGRPDLKTPLPYRLYMNARVAVVGEEGDYMRLHDGRFVHRRHLGPLDEVADDYVAVAERFMGVPYLWGGVTSDGLDCSGLVQAAMQMAGLDCPRDSDMQMNMPGEHIDAGSMEEPKRGDLVFWPGHVGVMLNDFMLLHANAHHMEVAAEPLFKTITRIATNTGDDMLGLRRFS